MKKIGLLMIIVSMFSSAVIAYGCARGCGDATLEVTQAFFFWQTDEAEAEMKKCNCNPVNNDLMVWLHVQYHSGNNYYWEPGASTYNYDHELNTDKVSVSIVQDGITVYATLNFSQLAN